MNIERAIFVNDVFRGLYILEQCDTYFLYNPKREHCLKCNGETKFHWSRHAESDNIALFMLTKECRDAVIAKFVRLDLNTRGFVSGPFIPLHESDINKH